MKFVLIVLMSYPLHLFAASSLVTFDDIPMLVQTQNQHAKGVLSLKQAAEQRRGFLTRSFLPKVSLKAGQESYQTGTQMQRTEPYGFAEARMNLYRGGRDEITNRIVNAQASGASLTADQTLREEIAKARKSYWQLVAQKELAQILTDAIEENKKNLSAASARVKAGMVTETDRIGFVMHQTELEQDLARTKLAIENTQREFAVLLGLPSHTEIQTAMTIDHTHKDDLLKAQYTAEKSPVLGTLNLQVKEAELEKSLSSRWWTPTLDVYGGYGLYTFREREFESKNERYESLVGVQLTFEIFDALASSAETREKTLIASGLKQEYSQAVQELETQVQGAKAELELTHELMHSSEVTIQNAKKYLVRTIDEYRRGVKNSPDVLAASERNLMTRRRFVDLRRDYQLARTDLLMLLGQ